MSVDVDLSEVAKLVTELEAAGPKVEKVSSQRLGEIARTMRDEAVAAAPELTGHLRRNIYLRGGRDVRYVGSDVPYAGFVEFGTSVMTPQPWLWPAADRAQVDLIREYEKIGNPFD